MLEPHRGGGPAGCSCAPRRSRSTSAGDRIEAVLGAGARRRRRDPLPRRGRHRRHRAGRAPAARRRRVRVGAETIAQTGEPHAQPREAKPHCVQSFTYTFAAERGPPGERHVIRRPASTSTTARRSPTRSGSRSTAARSTARSPAGWSTGSSSRCPARRAGCGRIGAWSTPRFARSPTPDLALFNWPGNDYRDRSIIDRPAPEAAPALQDAKRVSLGFLHWLQTEAPAEGDAPRRARAHAAARRDGHRRRALEVPVHPRVAPDRRAADGRGAGRVGATRPGPRAAHFPDSVGVGWYPIDIHRAGARRRRHQLPHAAVPDPARRAGAGAPRRT